MMMVVRSSSKSVKRPKGQNTQFRRTNQKCQKYQKNGKCQRCQREVLDYIGKEQTYHPKTKIPPRYSPSAPGAFFIYLFIL